MSCFEVLVEKCGGLYGFSEDQKHKYLIVNLKKIKDVYQRDPDIIPVHAYPFFTNFEISENENCVIRLFESIIFCFCGILSKADIYMVNEKQLQEVDKPRPLSFYLLIQNIDSFPNAQIAFLF